MRRLLSPRRRYRRFNPYGPYDRSARQVRSDRSERYDRTQTSGVCGVGELHPSLVALRAAAIGLVLFGLAAVCGGQEPAQQPISFVLPAADFQPIPDDAYGEEVMSATPPVPEETLMLPPTVPTEQMPVLESVECETCQPDSPWLPEGRMPNGQYPDNWLDRCGGWPYANGPGKCDNWKVGCRWHVTVDGIVMNRDETDLDALQGQLEANDPSGTTGDPTLEQFDYGPGARVALMSQVGRCTGWDLQCVYEGVPEWHASIVYPKQTIAGASAASFVIPPDPNTEPGPPFPETFEQRSLHYTSSMQSGELNFLRYHIATWRPFFGVRYIKFDDEINDFFNQEMQAPLPGPRTESISPGPVPPAAPIVVNDPIGPSHETDRFNLFDIQNDLIGFQMGLLHDTWRVNHRLEFEGFISGGVYHNRIKYTNLMGIFTTQTFADNTRSVAVNDARIDESNIVNNDVREYSEIAYVTEASLSGVCRLNKCWALRGGYQMLWIANVHLADAAYLGDENSNDDLIFHGWHAGVECRR